MLGKSKCLLRQCVCHVALVLGFSAVMAGSAQAQSGAWPERPVRIVVGFSAGSVTDTVARAVAEQLSNVLGQPVVVENKPGANGAIAAGEVSRAAADGYTLLMSNSSSITINPQIYKSIPYTARDFAPVTMVMDSNFILTVNPDWAQQHRIDSVQDLVEYARRNPDALSYGSGGPGNVAHLAFAALSNRAQIVTTHIPYKSGALAQMALLGGEIHTVFDTWGALPQIAAGKSKPLAVTVPQRMPQLPDVPTMAEAGYDDFHVTFWAGLFAPKGTSPAIIDKLYAAAQGLSENPRARALISAQGVMAMLSPAAFSQRIEKEIRDWGAVIQREAISLD